MFRVTREWIHAHKTPRGSWTRNQLALIGVQWPPASGWIDRAAGHEIPDDARERFEAFTLNLFSPLWQKTKGV